MISKVIVFEDMQDHQERFRKTLEEAGCRVLVIDTSKPDGEHQRIVEFAPEAAIVDSQFDDDIDGAFIVAYLHKHFPEIPIVICSQLCNMPSKHEWLMKTYIGRPGVRAVIGKVPFPTGWDILNHCISAMP